MLSCAKVKVVKRTKAVAVIALVRSARVPGFFTHPPARHADLLEIEKTGTETRYPNVELSFQSLDRGLRAKKDGPSARRLWRQKRLVEPVRGSWCEKQFE